MKPFDPHAWLDQSAAVMGLAVPAVRRAAVAANLARLYALAQEILDFEPPPEAVEDGTPAP